MLIALNIQKIDLRNQDNSELNHLAITRTQVRWDFSADWNRYSVLYDIRNQTQDLEKDYDSKRHAEARLAKEHLPAELATIKQKINDLAKDRLRLEEEIKKMKRIKKENKTRLAEKKSFGQIFTR